MGRIKLLARRIVHPINLSNQLTRIGIYFLWSLYVSPFHHNSNSHHATIRLHKAYHNAIYLSSFSPHLLTWVRETQYEYVIKLEKPVFHRPNFQTQLYRCTLLMISQEKIDFIPPRIPFPFNYFLPLKQSRTDDQLNLTN